MLANIIACAYETQKMHFTVFIFTSTSDPFYELLIKSKLLATCITVKTLLAQKEQSIFLMHERYHDIYETLTTDQHQVWPSLSSCGIYCIFGEIVVINSYKSHDLSFPRLRSGEYRLPHTLESNPPPHSFTFWRLPRVSMVMNCIPCRVCIRW